MNLFESVTGAGDLFENLFDTRHPDKGRWIGVPRGEKTSDSLLQLLHAAENTPAHGFLAEFGKPAFDEVEPTGTGGNEVQDKTGMFGQPAPDSFMAMGAVVIEDQVQGHGAGKLLIQAAQKLDELLMPVARVALADDSPFDDLKCRKESGRPVALIVMSEGAAASTLERQSRLSAIQGLNLALLIDAEHDGILRRSEINPDDIGELFQKLRITRKFETLGEVRLDLVFLPDAMNRVFAHALNTSQGARAPMGCSRWFGLQGGFHHATHEVSGIRGLASPPWRDLPNTADALLTCATPPEGHRSPMDSELRGDLSILSCPSGSLNNPRPEDNLLWR